MSIRASLFTAGAAVVMLVAGAPLVAHHAFSAEFDSTRPVTLKGQVTKMEWINPHAWLHMEVRSPDGKVVSWAVEGGAPNALFREGWRKDSVKLGDVLTVEGSKAKDGSLRANANRVTLPDGRRVFAGSSGGAR